MTDLSQLDVTTKSGFFEAPSYVQRFKDAIFAVIWRAFMDDADPRTRRHRHRLPRRRRYQGSRRARWRKRSHGPKGSSSRNTFRILLRVTDEASVKIVEHTLNKVVNLDIQRSSKRRVRGHSASQGTTSSSATKSRSRPTVSRLTSVSLVRPIPSKQRSSRKRLTTLFQSFLQPRSILKGRSTTPTQTPPQDSRSSAQSAASRLPL